MAEVMTYTSLKADVRRYLERGSVEDTQVYEQIPRLIMLAQRAIADAIKIQGLITVVQSTLVAGQFAYPKPDRWRTTVSMLFGTDGGGTSNPLFPRSYEYCRMYAPTPAVRGVPKFYSDYDYQHWLIVPTPIAAYPWEISYYELPPLLSDVLQTNWTTDYAPNALLYRTLLEAAPFLKNDERIATWQSLYGESLSALNVQDIKKIVDRSATRQEA
jgi:hypothetical protein